VSTCIVFCLCAAWSLVTPIGAANDEHAQLVKAASVVRGELVGPTPSGKTIALAASAAENQCHDNPTSRCDKAVTVVTVPESFADLGFPTCFAFPTQPAGCEHGVVGSGRETLATTYVGRYPPLYYVIVGLPSLGWHSNLAVYLMRLISGLLSALFLGLALALAARWSRSRLLLVAVAVAVTPTVIFYGSVVNPSGLEMASSVCVWTGGLILVLDRARRPPVSLVAATGTAAAVMVLTRGLSPLWLILIAASIAALSPRSLVTLIQRHSVRIAVAVVMFTGVLAVGYIFWARTLSVAPIGQAVPEGTSQWGSAQLALGRTSLLVSQFVGTFDGVAIGPPLAVTMLWLVSASTVLVLGFVTSLRRHAAVIVGLVVASLALPTALMVSQAHNDGLVWQARDGFPLYAGILLVAGAVAGRNGAMVSVNAEMLTSVRGVNQRLAVLLASIVGAVQLGDFVWALRRYAVGLGGVLNPFVRVPGGWSPPITSVVLAGFMTLATIVYCWWIVHLSNSGGTKRLSAHHGGMSQTEHDDQFFVDPEISSGKDGSSDRGRSKSPGSGGVC
jgi:hypothetical protein